jgi:hypothetical protein
MIKLIKSNWRELVALLATIAILFALLTALGTVEVSESGPLSTLVSLAVTLIGGVAKFALALALAWFGLAITLPEANRFIVGHCFDSWWTHLTQSEKGYISLTAVAVLSITAALCMFTA